MFEIKGKRIESMRKRWWFGKWSMIAYICAAILFTLCAGLPAMVILARLSFLAGAVLALVQNNSSSLMVMDLKREEISQPEYEKIWKMIEDRKKELYLKIDDMDMERNGRSD